MNYLFTGMELFEGEGKQDKVSLSGIAKIFLMGYGEIHCK